MGIEEKARRARDASSRLMASSAKARDRALESMARSLRRGSAYLLAENSKDLRRAEALVAKGLLSRSVADRLRLSRDRIDSLAKGIESVARMKDPINRVTYSMQLDKGLELSRITCPIGVVCAVFEARPDALVQIASLCLKSGNAVMLKGGSEAGSSNAALVSVIRKATSGLGLPDGWISTISDRKEFDRALKLRGYIDLVIARGGRSLVEHVLSSTKIPVLGHTEGLCHVYVDGSADQGMALSICVDAKTNYPAACNSARYVLVDKKIARRFLPALARRYESAGVAMRCSPEAIRELERAGQRSGSVSRASEADWRREFLDLTVAIRIVDGVDEAISWINGHGSRHTDAIVTGSDANAKRFASMVDSSSVMINASTRFADGYRYGLGAEVGINTGKIHARGPTGIEGLVTYKYVLVGNGHLVGDYTGPKPRRRFTHIEHASGGQAPPIHA